MESLVEILTIEDLNNRIKTLRLVARNIELHKDEIKLFSNLLSLKFRLPIISAKYDGKIMHVDWILFQNEVYLCLNCVYDKRGRLKLLETVSQQLVLERLDDLKNVRTLAGKRFRKRIILKNSNPVNMIDTKSLFLENKTAKIIENGLERFSLKEKIYKKFGLQLHDKVV